MRTVCVEGELRTRKSMCDRPQGGKAVFCQAFPCVLDKQVGVMILFRTSMHGFKVRSLIFKAEDSLQGVSMLSTDGKGSFLNKWRDRVNMYAQEIRQGQQLNRFPVIPGEGAEKYIDLTLGQSWRQMAIALEDETLLSDDTFLEYMH